MRSRIATVLLVGAVALSCSSPPATPTPPTQEPPPQVVNLAGSWSGTLESTNFPSHAITMTIVQGGSCVDGAWLSSSDTWSGALSGYAGADSYSGQITIEFTTDSGDRCNGVATTNGPASTDTISLKSTGFMAIGQCATTLPQSLVVKLHRN